MLFGLKISLAIFQRAAEIPIRPLINDGKCFIYIDDIIIFSSIFNDHTKYIQEVFDALEKYKNKLYTPEERRSKAKEDEPNFFPHTLDWYDGVAYDRRSRKIYIPRKFHSQILIWSSRHQQNFESTKTLRLVA